MRNNEGTKEIGADKSLQDFLKEIEAYCKREDIPFVIESHKSFFPILQMYKVISDLCGTQGMGDFTEDLLSVFHDSFFNNEQYTSESLPGMCVVDSKYIANKFFTFKIILKALGELFLHNEDPYQDWRNRISNPAISNQ